MVGRTVSHYKVLDEVSRGGMGIVYKALDLKLKRQVALKVLPSELVTDPERKRRFIQEAQAAAALNHPHIAIVHEIDEADGVTFIAMELIQGEKLRDLLASKKLSPTRSLELAIEIAEGLALAHENGVLHRDLKPANIMVTREGHAKIIDFGLAKLVESFAPQASDIETASRHETEAGIVMGTVSYMSPEQARGDKVDRRSDVFSFGIVLYEMLSGRLPFEGRTAADTLSAILKDPTPQLLVGDVDPEAAPQLQRIVEQCLAKTRDDRYHSMADLLLDLRRALPLLASDVAVAPRSRRRFRSRLLVRGVGLAGLVLVALALNWFVSQRQRSSVSDSPSSRVPVRRSVAVLGFKNLVERSETKWLSTALSELFTSELAAGGKLRTIPGENVSRMKIDLELPDAESFGTETLARIRKNLGCDLVVLGSYLAFGESGGGKLRLDVRLQDAARGETIATVTEAGSEQDLLDLISRTGARLRDSLDVVEVSSEDRAQVRTSLPSNPEAARLYVEGLTRLRGFDALGARDLLERAVALEPEHSLAHSALGKAWSELGYDERAKAEARKAFELSQALPREERLLVEARLRETTSEWQRAVEVYRTLFEFFPDNVDYGLSLAAAQASAGKARDALAILESLRQQASPFRVDPRIDLAEASAAGALSDYKRARAAAATAADKAKAHGARLLVARARRQEGWALERLGQPRAAIAAAEEARSMFSQAGDRRGVAQAWNNLFAVLFSQGDLDGAQRAVAQVLAIYREIGDRRGARTGLTNVAALHYARGDLAGALRTWQEALAVSREIDDKAAVAMLLNNIGAIHRLRGQLDQARAMYEDSLAIFRQIGKKEGMATALINLAEIHAIQGELARAKRLYAESLEMRRETGLKQQVAEALARLGGLALAEADPEAARAKYEEALAMQDEVGAKLEGAESRVALAEVSLEEGRIPEADVLVRRAVDAFEGEKSPDGVIRAYQMLARVLIAEGKTADARAAIDSARARSARSQNRLLQMDVEITAARIRARQSTLSAAIKSLESTLAEAKRLGAVGLEFRARLALGEIEIKLGSGAAGRVRLQELEKEAASKQFRLIARKAAAASRTSGTGRSPEL